MQGEGNREGDLGEVKPYKAININFKQIGNYIYYYVFKETQKLEHFQNCL